MRGLPIVRDAALFAGCVVLGFMAFGGELTITSAFDDPASRIAAKELHQRLEGVAGAVELCRDVTLEPQAWRVVADGGRLVVQAKDGLGALYGVLNFLELIGYRFFAPDCTVAPKDVTAAYVRAVPATGRSTVMQGNPAIKSRYFYTQGGREVDAMWFLRNRGTYSESGLANTETVGSPRDNHTMGFYAQRIRRADEPHGKGFCLMDEGVRHRVAEAMKEQIRADRKDLAGMPDYELPRIYELSQNDGGNDFPCQCEKCLAAKKSAGSWSGPNIRFTSAVAAEVAKEFPDVRVRTFAYSYTEKAPEDGVKAAENLIIRYCRSFVFQPLTAETANGKRLMDWSRCVNEKHVWGYWRGFSGPTFPLVKPRADIESELRFCRDMKVRGYFAQADNPYDRSFSFLQAYLALKLMEDPERSVDMLSREFMRAYYGKAERPMEAYLSYLERREKEEFAKIDPEFVASVNSGYLAMFTDRAFLDDEFFVTVDGFLSEAERAAQDDANVLERIARERHVFEGARTDWLGWRPEAIGQNGTKYGHSQRFAKDSEARLGTAVCDARGKVEGDYTIVLKDDWTGVTSEFRLKSAEIPWDESYRLYKVGKIHLVCESWIGFNGTEFFNWVPHFSNGIEDRDVWVSMKFKAGNVYYDGLWFVPEGADSPEVRSIPRSFAREALQKFVDSGEMAGAISVLDDNGRREVTCLGFADAATRRPITLDDVFMQCSQTKGFCGVTVAQLVEAGKIGLDDPVSKYLPEFGSLWIEMPETNGERRLVKAQNTLRVRHVMNHTGGFPFELPNARRMGGWSRRMPLRSVAATAAAQPILFEPGTKVAYSNIGIDIGAAVVEVVSGHRWECFLQKRVLDPLEMKDTGFWPSNERLERRIGLYEVCPGEKARPRPSFEWMPAPHDDGRVFPSAGAGLWTTVRDQLKFYMMLMNLGRGENGVRVLKEKTVRDLLAVSTRPKGMGGYSLGLYAPEADAEDAWFGHGGALNTSCMVNWHRRQLKLWVAQFCGKNKKAMCHKEKEAAAAAFFGAAVNSSGVEAYTGRMK